MKKVEAFYSVVNISYIDVNIIQWKFPVKGQLVSTWRTIEWLMHHSITFNHSVECLNTFRSKSRKFNSSEPKKRVSLVLVKFMTVFDKIKLYFSKND